MRYLLLLLSFTLNGAFVFAGKISGTVSTASGEPLPFTSITVKGSKQATSTNAAGYFFLELPAGTYTLICRHVGYERLEQTISVGNEAVAVQFVLTEQRVNLKEVVVKAGDEDPAYAIIRNAIRKRKEYLNENEEYRCEVYSKGVMQLRNFPDKFMGQKVDFEDGDSSKRKMIYLSETVSQLAVARPNKLKIDVLSTRVSGQSDGFGFAGGRFFSFYENIVSISSALNPRGFVSPIAENAISMYRYKYEGVFFEEGQMINKIKVIPRRKYEPCFEGYINIVDDEWRIHSLNLRLTKERQMSFADTLQIEQLYQRIAQRQWVVQSQVLLPAINFFGFDAYGSFVNVYRNFELQPGFGKKDFDQTILRYTTGSNKKPVAYWDSIRPLALSQEEFRDYIKKDSLEQKRKDPAYLDSLDRRRNRIKLNDILLTGKTFNKETKRLTVSTPSLLTAIGFNPVDGWVLDVPVTITKAYTDRKNFSVTPHLRYGFSSKDFYAWATAQYTFGNRYLSNISLSGGRKFFQLNNENPIEPFQNTFSSLFYKNNFMKIYAADFLRVSTSRGLGRGLTVNGSFNYQDRRPLDNTTDFNLAPRKDQPYLPNYPTELMAQNFSRHQAAILTLGVTYRHRSRYIEFPDRVINIGSRWPLLNLQYVRGISGIIGSDVQFQRWQFTISDNLNAKLYGNFAYRFQTGGFLDASRVEVQDLKHFAGNRLFRGENFLTTFQLPQYYQFSNSDRLYGALFAEHHFNGFLTNKIPGFRKLNWHLVAGARSLWLQQQTYYEWNIGFENIFRLFRFDVVTGHLNGVRTGTEFRIGSLISIGNNAD